jgi:hypothetical protein
MSLWAAYLVRGALLLIYIAALVAIGLSPVVTRLERRRLGGTRPLPRWVAILEVYLLLVVTIAIFSVLVVPPLIEQARGFWTARGETAQGGVGWTLKLTNPYCNCFLLERIVWQVNFPVVRPKTAKFLRQRTGGGASWDAERVRFRVPCFGTGFGLTRRYAFGPLSSLEIAPKRFS